MFDRQFTRFIHWLGYDLGLTPNQVTVGRILIFIPGWLLWFFRFDVAAATGLDWRIFGWFAFAIVTLVIFFDLVDGALARQTGQVSSSGKALDPAVDKIITYSTLALFWPVLSHPAFIILLALDITSTFLRGVSVHGANEFGKKKALSQNLAKLFFGTSALLGVARLAVIGNLLLWLAVTLAFISVCIRLLPARSRNPALVLIPQLFTLGNLLAGLFAIRAGMTGHLLSGIFAIFFAMSCDIADGAVARRLAVTSTFGKYFDTLADLVSFGIAPAALAASATDWSASGLVAGGLYILATAIRLYDYGRSKDKTPAGFFRGMPSPAGAWLAMAAILCLPAALVPAGMVATGILMCCFPVNWQHFSAILPTISVVELAVSFLLGLGPALLIHPTSFIAGPILLYALSPLWRKPPADVNLAAGTI